MSGERISPFERWASVLASGAIGTAVVAYIVAFPGILILGLFAGHFYWPQPWFWGMLGGFCGLAALVFGTLGWSDPPWGGVTFHAREHGYARAKLPTR